jgi:hypothetical protein
LPGWFGWAGVFFAVLVCRNRIDELFQLVHGGIESINFHCKLMFGKTRA